MKRKPVFRSRSSDVGISLDSALFVAMHSAALPPQVIYKYLKSAANSLFYLQLLKRHLFNSLLLLNLDSFCSAFPFSSSLPLPLLFQINIALTFTLPSLTFSWWLCRCIMWLLPAGLCVRWTWILTRLILLWSGWMFMVEVDISIFPAAV